MLVILLAVMVVKSLLMVVTLFMILPLLVEVVAVLVEVVVVVGHGGEHFDKGRSVCSSNVYTTVVDTLEGLLWKRVVLVLL